MNVLRFVFQVIVALLKIVAYEWILAAIDIVRRFWKALKRFCARGKLPHPLKHPSADCVTVQHPAMRRPDPCIYSQAYLMGLGLPVTWDNPDIILKRSGVVVPEYGLLPGTEYEIEATIWNNSYDAPVVGMNVDFSFLSFGVATTSTAIGSRFVSVGVKGSANHPAKVAIPWTTPPTPGHYCIQAKLNWIDDANPDNNLGQNNIDVAEAHSAAHFTFRLRNPFAENDQFRFVVDTYTPLELPECKEAVSRGELRSQRIRRIVAFHRSQNFAIPAGWSVTISPDTVSLAPDQEVAVQVDITPPAGFTGEQPFNVNAFAEGKFAGGVRLVVTAS
jgi:hypothetical protein